MDLARFTGLVWLAYFLTAIPGGLLMSRSRDVGVGLSLFSTACYIALTALLFALLEPIDRPTALVAAFMGLVGCALTVTATLLQTSANTELSDLGKRAIAISFPFFGFFMVATGSIIVRSTLLPQVFGALFIAAGAGWVLFLVPPVARVLQGGLFVFGGLTEVALMLWLVIRGVAEG